jgi:hypothetical protein
MDFNLHVWLHLPGDDAEKAALKRMESKLDSLLSQVTGISKSQVKELQTMQADVQAIIDQAKANHDIEESGKETILAVLAKLEGSINNADTLSADDKAAIQAEIADLKASAGDLGAAIATGNAATVNPPAGGDTGAGGTGGDAGAAPTP